MGGLPHSHVKVVRHGEIWKFRGPNNIWAIARGLVEEPATNIQVGNGKYLENTMKSSKSLSTVSTTGQS